MPRIRVIFHPTKGIVEELVSADGSGIIFENNAEPNSYIKYTPGDASKWSTVPDDIAEALDTLASGSGGAGGITQLTGDVGAGPGTGLQTATVTRLQGNPVSAASPADGNALVWNNSVSEWQPTALSSQVTSVGASSPLSSSGGTTPNVSLISGSSPGDVLTWNGSVWASAPTAAAGITQLTGDVVSGPGSGSQISTVVKLQGNDVSTTAPTANQILQWISGTSKWTPTANGVGLGSKIFLVVEGGAYATVQDAIDAASDWDVILVGPKAAGASWGPMTFSPGKRLSVIGFSQEQATQIKVDSVTFNVSSGLNILLNAVLVKGLFINSSFVGTQGINFYGSFPGRLRLQECFIYNSGATGTGVVSNNSGAGSSLSLDNCILQSGAYGGIGLDHQQGYTIVRNDSEISRYQYPIQCAAGSLEILNAIIDNSGVANEAIRVTGGLVTVGYSTIKNTTTNASGVNLTTAGATLGMGDATFAVGTGTGYCVTGVAGTFFLYGHITYSNSAAAAYNVKVKNTITSLAVTQTFTSSP